MQKSMTGIFNDLASIRRERAEARNTWGVYRVNKNKKLSAQPVVTCIDQPAAEKKAAKMELLNPGVKYVAQAL